MPASERLVVISSSTCGLAVSGALAHLGGVKWFLVALAGCLLCCQCAPRIPGRLEGIDTNPFGLLEKQATAKNRDASRIRIPVLKSPTFEKRWGSPQLLVGPHGGYALRYRDPRDSHRHLTIFGSPTLYPTAGSTPPPYTNLGFDPQRNTYAPAEVRQAWQHARVAGKEVRFYIAEAASDEQPVQISSETFRLTAADGRTASYRIRTVSDPKNPADSVARWFESLGFH